MALSSGGNAPYAPAATVIDVVTRYRERGLSTPFTTEVLERAGVSESLSRRTMQSLKLLQLIDADGNPTPEFDQAAKSPDADYREKMSDLLIETYSEVLNFADPSVDSYDKVRDAFRGFLPRGQQERMVTLFLGLMDFIGVDTAKAAGSRSEGARPNGGQRASVKKTAAKKSSPAGKKAPRDGPRDDVHDDSTGDLPPGLLGLLRQIPRGGAGWPKARRDEFLVAFTAVLNFTVPVRESEPVAGTSTGNAGNEEDLS